MTVTRLPSNNLPYVNILPKHIRKNISIRWSLSIRICKHIRSKPICLSHMQFFPSKFFW